MYFEYEKTNNRKRQKNGLFFNTTTKSTANLVYPEN